MTTFRHLIPHSSVPMSLNVAKCNLGKVKLKARIPACFDTVGAPHSLQGHVASVCFVARTKSLHYFDSQPTLLFGKYKIYGLGKYSPLTLSM